MSPQYGIRDRQVCSGRWEGRGLGARSARLGWSSIVWLMDDPVHYTSAEEDSARWLDFPFRDGDVVISTRSKSGGTTWMQQICLSLALGNPELPDALSRLSPWLDWLVEPYDDVLARLERQDHRRVLKTHKPRPRAHPGAHRSAAASAAPAVAAGCCAGSSAMSTRARPWTRCQACCGTRLDAIELRRPPILHTVRTMWPHRAASDSHSARGAQLDERREPGQLPGRVAEPDVLTHRKPVPHRSWPRARRRPAPFSHWLEALKPRMTNDPTRDGRGQEGSTSSDPPNQETGVPPCRRTPRRRAHQRCRGRS